MAFTLVTDRFWSHHESALNTDSQHDDVSNSIACDLEGTPEVLD